MTYLKMPVTLMNGDLCSMNMRLLDHLLEAMTCIGWFVRVQVDQVARVVFREGIEMFHWEYCVLHIRTEKQDILLQTS